ncbi:MAG: choice-of-anchor D domain-containing protein, partial [Terriglobia bacterium]
TTAGADDVYDSGSTAATSEQVSLQPSHVYYVRIWTITGGNSYYSDTSFQTAAPAPAISFSAASLSFGTQTVGATSSAQILTVTNTGTANLAISAVTFGGTNARDFAEGTDACTGATVVPKGTCAIGVTFTPTASGPRKAFVSLSINVTDDPQGVILTGVGAAAGLAPANLSFNSQTTGTSSAPQTITLTNEGTVAMNLWQIAIAGANAGDFSQTTACGSSLGPGRSCTVSVTFTPMAAGSRTASVVFSDDGGGSPQSVPVSGIGVVSSARRRLSGETAGMPGEGQPSTGPHL